MLNKKMFWRHLFSPVYRYYKNRAAVQIKKGLIVYGAPDIDIYRGGTLSIGKNAVLYSISNYTASGASKPCIFRVMEPNASISIGDNCRLNGTTIVCATGITIGHECLIGADVMICDTDLHPIHSEHRRQTDEETQSTPVSIGNNVSIGARSTIFKGVTIGNNSVIGAGSIVMGNIPANVIAAGNPARVLRHI